MTKAIDLLSDSAGITARETKMKNQTMTDATEDLDVTAVLASLDEDDTGDETVEAVTEIDDGDVIDETEIEAELAATDETEDLDPADAAEIEGAIAIAEVYAESAAASASDDAAVEADKPKKTRAASAGPKTVRDINDLDAKHFVLTLDEPDDLAANKAAVIARRPKQVKVAEKFDNVLTALAVEKKPSHYTMVGFALLEKAGTITSNEMVKGMVAAGIGESTARSQAGQMMALFPALQIADRDGKNLKINGNSLIAEALKLLAAS